MLSRLATSEELQQLVERDLVVSTRVYR